MAKPKKALVIVESPSKAKTIQKYLGREYIVKASVGHIKDLPKNKLGVNPDKGFNPEYQLIASKTKIITELKKFAALVPELYLATDPDREGEAIAWHINEELKARGKKVHRVLFNAITKPAILHAMANPQKLNSDLYHAQQSRRILDRLVGYKISPLLWDKVKRGISAGRVQSVALRLVVEREKEIQAFKPREYWKVSGVFEKDGKEFKAGLFKVNAEDPELPNQEAVNRLLASVSGSTWKVRSLEKKERARKPAAPFITSRLQQEAAKKLGFSAKKTMTIAQHLYEGVNLGDNGTHGLITYMRTDSVRVEPVALETLRQYIAKEYGPAYLPTEPHVYKSRKSAQEAHEAIRPTSLEFSPEFVKSYLEKDEFRLYQLIWNRFVAAQMNPAIFDQTSVELVTEGKRGSGFDELVFRETGSIIKFNGFTAVYAADEDEAEKVPGEVLEGLVLPALQEGDPVQAKALTPTQHFTLPPPRYTDSSLIRDLEEKGIGRPSTYAQILSNLQDREYVERREARYFPSELGMVVTDLLVTSFPDILNAEFTAEMENQLDEIGEGNLDWKKALATFWKPFKKTLETAKKTMKDVKRQEVPTDVKCEKCSNIMVIKWGKLGSFLACSNYPDCKNTQDFKKDEKGKIVIVPKEYTDKKCKKCEKPLLVKSGKFGKFLACSDYPECKFTDAITLGVPCPTCKEGEIAQRQSRYRRVFYSCNQWPKCTYALWDKPIVGPCPQCQFPLLTTKITKRAGLIHKCPQKECGYMVVIDPDAGRAPPPEPEENEATSVA